MGLDLVKRTGLENTEGKERKVPCSVRHFRQ